MTPIGDKPWMSLTARSRQYCSENFLPPLKARERRSTSVSNLAQDLPVMAAVAKIVQTLSDRIRYKPSGQFSLAETHTPRQWPSATPFHCTLRQALPLPRRRHAGCPEMNPGTIPSQKSKARAMTLLAKAALYAGLFRHE